MNETGSTVTTRPDWGTRDPQACERLGEALSRRGYVFWDAKKREWIVLDPEHPGEWRQVRALSDSAEPQLWWLRLWCECSRLTAADSPCVHKAAVYYEVNKPSQYRMYREGY